MPINQRMKSVFLLILQGCVACSLMLLLFSFSQGVSAQSAADTATALNTDHIADLRSRVHEIGSDQAELLEKMAELKLSMTEIRIQNEQMKSSYDQMSARMWAMAISLFGLLMKVAWELWRDKKRADAPHKVIP